MQNKYILNACKIHLFAFNCSSKIDMANNIHLNAK